MHADLDEEKNLFSFRSEDSYERLCFGPALVRVRPANVPELHFDGFPEYESSSDEEQPPPQQPNQPGTGNQQAYYQESLKYIENFYNKYAQQQQNLPNNGHHQSADFQSSQKKVSVDFSEAGMKQFDGNTTNQMSYQDSLSRDEDDDIREEIRLA